MKTSVERVDETTVKLSVTVEAERVDRAVDDAARRLAQEVRVPGFRPGKAPRRVLETRLGRDTLVQEAVRQALPEFYAEAARSEELDVVGPPELDVTTFEAGQEAAFTATVEVRPEFDVPDFAGAQVPHPEWEVTEDEVDAQVERLRERFAELETVERPAQLGDHVRITVSGSRDGRAVEEASADDVLYEVRDPAESESELDRNLAGAQAGAILRFRDRLGEDYGDLAGEELDFTAIVKEVKAKRLPELDDDFALTASEFDTIDELRAGLRAQLQEQKTAYARSALRGRVIEVVAERVDVPLPKALIQQEVRNRLNQVAHQAEHYGIGLEQYLQAAGVDPDQIVAQLEEEAKQTVKAQLLVDAIGREAGVEVTEEDLSTEVTRQAARLGQAPDELARLMTQPEHLATLVSDAFRRKAIDHMLAQVEVLAAPPVPDPGDETEGDDDEPTAAEPPVVAGGSASEGDVQG